MDEEIAALGTVRSVLAKLVDRLDENIYKCYGGGTKSRAIGFADSDKKADGINTTTD